MLIINGIYRVTYWCVINFFQFETHSVTFSISCTILVFSKRKIVQANHFDVISVVNPEDAVVMLPAAVGAAVLDHEHLHGGVTSHNALPKASLANNSV